MNVSEKKIVVTGGAGFLGSHVVKKLIERGVSKENIFIPRSQMCDLRDLNNCKKVIRGKNIVIHCAAITGNIEFHCNYPGMIFYDNVRMSISLLEASRLERIERFISIGSVTEYPASAPMPYREKEYWEGCPEDIHAFYAFAKKMLFVQERAYEKQYGLRSIHLLLTSMFGPYAREERNYVVLSLIRKVSDAIKNKKSFIEVWGSGKAKREFLYVEDAAEAIVLAIEQYDTAEPLNIGSGYEISIKHLAQLICKIMHFSGEIHFDTSKPEGCPRRVLDISRAKKEIGFMSTTSLSDGLEKTIQWYKSHNLYV